MRSMSVNFIVVMSLALALPACKTLGQRDSMPTGSIQAQPRSEADWRQTLDKLAPQYNQKPNDRNTALYYGVALRQTGQTQQSVAVLQKATLLYPKDIEILGEYGRSLADNRNFEQALDVLSRSHSPERPDWRIYNVMGTVYDQLGKPQEAIKHYDLALKIAPNEPKILSNLGLSYALAGQAKQGETLLRQAMAVSPDPRIRQNLALIVGLQGRTAEAEQLVTIEGAPQVTKDNIESLRAMLAGINPKRV